MISRCSLFSPPSKSKTIMQDNNITDVEFKEVPMGDVPTNEVFLPAHYVVNALTAAGHPKPMAWLLDIDPRAETAEEEKDRIFFTNRALRLYLSEQESPDNISVRMVLAEGIPADKWCALIDKAVVPWLMGLFDEKGQRIDQKKVEEVLAEEGVAPAETAVNHPSVGGEILSPATFDEEEQLKGSDEEAQACCNQPTDCFLKETPCMNRVEDGSMDSLPGSITE